jgi:PilZ domain
VLKVVRSTHLLVIHELRRYARLPMVTQAVAETSSGSVTVTTVDISSGGVSVRSSRPLAIQDTVRITLTLPGTPRLTLRAQVCWERKGEDKVYGLRFDSTDDGRAKIRGWIDQQLEIV